VTTPGRTVEETVTAQAPSSTSGASGTELNNEGYAQMQAGDYASARPLLEQAVARLRGTGSLGEAYADYNLAYTRFALGDCTGVLALLESSERIQGHRSEITRLRRRAQRAC
jgi:uncharacterized protein with von Willebrand factor type A (vWA) domain